MAAHQGSAKLGHVVPRIPGATADAALARSASGDIGPRQWRFAGPMAVAECRRGGSAGGWPRGPH